MKITSSKKLVEKVLKDIETIDLQMKLKDKLNTENSSVLIDIRDIRELMEGRNNRKCKAYTKRYA